MATVFPSCSFEGRYTLWEAQASQHLQEILIQTTVYDKR